MANCHTVVLLSICVPLLLLLLSLRPSAAEDRQADHRAVRLLDRFDNRYPDGSYEYRFELDDGTARYERGYFAMVDKVKTLMVVGYYSYRMSDGRYITVFYNADQFGYRQNQSITPQVYPNLPRSIEMPMPASGSHSFQSSATSTSTGTSTTSPPQTTTSRRGGRF
ncbi:larval cuticle protein LCP-14 [Drosophila guanche]|uniref:Larval cuticle protein 16/17 n=1 Tax=Drosophila guanche TaxID=7266 RepID=A0A3B0JZN9_DROGU|nr:larval cuticle protein LCP-14 [Drosophila guanche]SPP86533.1 Hypothetical predicted protein [Drosophila guanche]